MDSLAGSFIFSSLTYDERCTLIDAMEIEYVSCSTSIIEQGYMADYFYVVENGHVIFFIDGNLKGVCTCGALFGELAFLYKCPHDTTCMASSNCELWKVYQRTFRYTLANNATQNSIKLVDGSLRCLYDMPLPQVTSKIDRSIHLKDIVKHCIIGIKKPENILIDERGYCVLVHDP